VTTSSARPKLTAERLCDIWMEVQRESLGPALELDGDYRWYWSYIPHFIHSPFYVYAYAFGDCLVNSLYAAYEDAHHGFAERTSPSCAPAARCATRNSSPPSPSTPPTPNSGRRASASSPLHRRIGSARVRPKKVRRRA